MEKVTFYIKANRYTPILQYLLRELPGTIAEHGKQEALITWLQRLNEKGNAFTCSKQFKRKLIESPSDFVMALCLVAAISFETTKHRMTVPLYF